MHTNDIQLGMTVYGTDDAEFGEVTEVWPYTDSHGFISAKDHQLNEYGPVTATTDLVASDKGYFQVKQGALLGFGGKELYVPFTDVRDTIPGERITVNCTEETCRDRYGKRPDVLDKAI
ncbi:MAG: hypothetical protein ACR2JC_07270 [Chloroflexota bacterium]|nr:MAG: hypothetical protein DLM70_14785 [Chloroflexota bacterium]